MHSPVRFAPHHRSLVLTLVLLWIAGLAALGLLLLLQLPYVPLWYSLVEPAEQLATLPWIAAPAALSTMLLALSLFFGRKTDVEHDEYLATLSLWGGCILLGFLLIAFLRIFKILV